MPCTRYTFFLILLIIPFFALAQSAIPLTGKLQEASTEKSLPFATVGLYALPDSNMVTNALTETDGRFSLEARPGNYYALFQYVGYEDRYLSPVEVQAGMDTLSLGKVEMSTDAIALQEVEVRAERSQMEFKLDKRVFNVGKDLTNAGNNAADILDNVPSVSVDPEGNVSLRGSQGVRILINGQPSGLLSAGDTEALQRMQGDMIERVEVITNPSARYEAEGEAGIINIILKKEEKKGFNGSFGLTAGQPANYGASYNLNYRRRAFNFFSNFGLDYRRAPGGGNATQRFFENGELTNFFTSETSQNRGGLGGYLQMAVPSLPPCSTVPEKMTTGLPSPSGTLTRLATCLTPRSAVPKRQRKSTTWKPPSTTNGSTTTPIRNGPLISSIFWTMIPSWPTTGRWMKNRLCHSCSVPAILRTKSICCCRPITSTLLAKVPKSKAGKRMHPW